MRSASRTAPLLLIGVALIGCGKENGGQSQGKVDPSLPVVSITIPDLT